MKPIKKSKFKRISKKVAYATALAPMLFSSTFANAQQEKKPNIILFIVDDMGWQDTSVPFANFTTDNNRYMKTPGMEKLASEGVVFTNAYSSSPVSSPTRCSMMTGKNPARTHITNWIPGEGDEGAAKQKYEVPHWRVSGLNHKDITLPKLLNESGYNTAIIGKGHMGDYGTDGADPKKLGFKVSVAATAAGHPASYYVPYGDPSNDHHVPDLEEFYKDSLYLTDALTIKANRLIDSLATKSDKPFFLWMAHYAVHMPIMPDPSLVKKFQIEGKTKTEAAYASMLASMDKSLLSVMDQLKKSGADKNTIIIFMSDNGGVVSHGGNKKNGIYPTTCSPIQGGKGFSYEGGIRVPMIISWPGVTHSKRSDEPIVAYDLFPTILNMANATGELKKAKNIDGKDISPILNNNSEHIIREEPLVWHFPHYWAASWLRAQFPGIRAYSSIREGDWKLTYAYDKESVELYNIKQDIGERNNLIYLYPQKAKELCDKLRKTLTDMDAQTPIDRETNKPIDLPHIPKALNL